MKIKIYLFRLTIAVTAFIFGISSFSVRQYFQSIFRAKEQKIELAAPVEIEPVKIEEITEPFGIEPGSSDESVKEIEYEFDAGGDYYIIGDLPKRFENFEIFSITTKNYDNASNDNNWEGIPIPPEGYVLTKIKFNFVRINISDKQIAFETESKGGISYKFVGKFIEEKVYEKDGEYSHFAVLEGHFVKMRNGKKIAQSRVKLGEAHPC